jgi:membrane fusion protein, multidrug efflux system
MLSHLALVPALKPWCSPKNIEVLHLNRDISFHLFKNVKAARIFQWFKNHIVIGTLLAVLILYFGYELLSQVLVYSRDAYITTDVIAVAPQVSGPLAFLAVKDNQVIRKGDLLLKIDPEPFQLDLDRLQASLELARANAKKAQEEVTVAADQIASRQAQLADAKITFERETELRKSGAIAQQALDDARRAYDVALALLEGARASQIAAEQEVSVQSATVSGAKAAVARAQYDLDRTVIVAPVSGRVAPLIVRAGDYLTAGHPVVAIVSDQNWRLVVNLPERHLQGLKVGQKVYCYIGSDPWRIHSGKVRSIAPGVARSLDPSRVLPFVELSTDWIRLPRRFPVEIDLGDLPQRQRLFVGSDANVFYAIRP